ncbi:dolichyl pyrophosphate phosphatase [Dichotomocladium elegans]|nr:dolichyl pyrophosphate phosphatase [Dichotomocladium elegans]
MGGGDNDDSGSLVLTSLSLTHVQFNPDDFISYAFAYITLLPLAILVFYASVIASRREVAGIVMLLGQLTNEVLNAILKESFQIARPHSHLGTGYGMPSSHAQFMGFFAVYGTLYLWTHIKLDHIAYKNFISLALAGLAALVAYSRIYLGYHTPTQVAVGMAIGCTYGACWHGLMERVIRPSHVIDRIMQHPIARVLYLRDMRHIDNVAKWDYEQWRKSYYTRKTE